MLSIQLPDRVYHGTHSGTLESFLTRLINPAEPSYWPRDRDFGSAFYTTTSLTQARDRGVSAARKHGKIADVDPCVLQVKVHLDRLPSFIHQYVFLGTSLEWAAYIYTHRLLRDHRRTDPCEARTMEASHPAIVSGPMADNRIGQAMAGVVKQDKSLEWFYTKITTREERQGNLVTSIPLDSAALGSQIAFSDLALAACVLELEGVHLITNGRWVYHDRERLLATRFLRASHR